MFCCTCVFVQNKQTAKYKTNIIPSRIGILAHSYSKTWILYMCIWNPFHIITTSKCFAVKQFNQCKRPSTEFHFFCFVVLVMNMLKSNKYKAFENAVDNLHSLICPYSHRSTCGANCLYAFLVIIKARKCAFYEKLMKPFDVLIER